MARPRKVFLSHRSVDKPLVRRFYTILQQLHYEPWLDEDAIDAGDVLNRAILNGIKQSCAAIFFLTPAFRDDRFLAAEIDHAISEQMERPDHFRIVSLLYPGADGTPVTVPPLLKRFAWKEPIDDLEALGIILRSGPLRVVDPRWPDDPALSISTVSNDSS